MARNHMHGTNRKPRFNPAFAMDEIFSALGETDFAALKKIRQNSVSDYARHLDLEKSLSEVAGYVTVARTIGDEQEVWAAARDGADVLRKRVLNNDVYAYAA